MYILAGILFGITLYTYTLSYVIIPIFLLLILGYMLYTKKIRIRKVFKKDYRGVPLINKNKIWIIDNYNYQSTDFDILYDLIQAGLVEKVEEER